ncbi:hypothetical protein BTW10_07725 [Chromohalobacter japonicus]|uniref:HTH lysR-type domain-containing protein n=1 Tax=Chromohalobacter japonicus TaxID=223900 RepID=A0A1Q8TDX0_9GAMM|nr:LysR family transcriptional regulator [Chromohalobacter japonicus]OLO11875.1 hypothetical protein BTW10_07725 [Chromohalobacter japonicus]
MLALPAWLASAEQLPRLTSGVFFFGYLLVFAITVSGGWVSDISGHVALAFVPTLILSLIAMAGTKRLLVSSSHLCRPWRGRAIAARTCVAPLPVIREETAMLSARVKLRHLMAFQEVARLQSLAKAAQALSITQPAMSKTIRELEEILETTLFERSPQGATLITAGLTLLRQASTAQPRGRLSNRP